MGYDITYHPISPEEMRRWYFEPIEDDTAIDRLAESERVDAEKLREAFGHYREFLSETQPDDSFEKTHGYLLAAAQGFFRPYFYNRGCLLSSLLDQYQRYVFQKYFVSLRTLVPEEYRKLEFSGGIEENWCGGAYLSAEGVEQLEYDIRHDANVALRLLQEFGPDGLRTFLKALRYAKKHGLGLLEATEVLSPSLDSSATDIDQAEFGYGNDEAGDTEIREIFASFGLEDILDRYSRYPVDLPKTPLDDIADKLLSTTVDRMRRSSKKVQKSTGCLNIILPVFFGIASCIYLGVFLWGAWMYSYERHLPQAGIQGEAVVTRRYTDGKSGKNYRIDYTLTVDGKEYPRTDVGPEKELWDTIDVGSRLPVVYLPGSPRVSRLQDKERGIGDARGCMIAGAFGLLFFGSFFVVLLYNIRSSRTLEAVSSVSQG